MNNPTETCPECGAIMRFIGAGVSKRTGKPYKPFFSCPKCQYTMNPFNQPTNGQVDKQDKIAQFTKDKNERIERLHDDTKESINWGLAWKLATNLVLNCPLYKDCKIVELREAILLWQTWYYRNITQQAEKEEEDEF